jgi:toxin ParE1/3/4
MKVVLSEAAYADLLDIGQNIKNNNPLRAKTFVDELYNCCQKIGIMPLAYPLLQNWEEHGIRRRTHGNYLILYRVDDGRIDILHILHGARNYEAVLSGKM